LALLLAQPVRDQAGSTFTAIVAITITCKGLPPPFERAQADADLSAGADQACTEVVAFYWTVLAPGIVNSGRVEQDSASV